MFHEYFLIKISLTTMRDTMQFVSPDFFQDVTNRSARQMAQYEKRNRVVFSPCQGHCKSRVDSKNDRWSFGLLNDISSTSIARTDKNYLVVFDEEFVGFYLRHFRCDVGGIG